MLPYDSLTRTHGRLPRSRSTTGPFLARVCLDDRGKVDTVEVLDAPEHLHHRIQRTLRHWRFRLPAKARGASKVCTIVGEHFEAWR